MDKKIYKKLDKFFMQYKQYTYKKDVIIIDSKQKPEGIYYITEGIVKEYVTTKNGMEIVLNMFKPSSFFSMSWAMNTTNNVYTYKAMTDVSVWIAPRDSVIDFMKKHPDVLFNLTARVFRGIEGMKLKIIYMASRNEYARLVAELLIIAKRFGEQIKNSKAIHITMVDMYLENCLGVSLESVKQEIDMLKKKNLIKFHRKTLVIPDIDLLEKELEQT